MWGLDKTTTMLVLHLAYSHQSWTVSIIRQYLTVTFWVHQMLSRASPISRLPDSSVCGGLEITSAPKKTPPWARLIRPGVASVLMPKEGTDQEWITSCHRMVGMVWCVMCCVSGPLFPGLPGDQKADVGTCRHCQTLVHLSKLEVG